MFKGQDMQLIEDCTMRMLGQNRASVGALSSGALYPSFWHRNVGKNVGTGVQMPDSNSMSAVNLQADVKRRIAAERVFQDMQDYWMALPRDGGLPDKAHLSPEFLPRSVLMNVVVFDVLRDPLDLVIRLIGSERRRTVIGKPLNQKLSERLNPELAAFLYAHVGLIEETGLPVYSENISNHQQERMHRTRRVAVAFSNRAVDPNRAVRLVFADLCGVEEWKGSFGPYPVEPN